MVGVASLGNGVGRIFWAWLSDLITRRATFAVMFILQVGLFWFLPGITMASMMTTITFIILMCYGGGFGTMPALHSRLFRTEKRWANLWVDADSMEFCQPFWTALHRPHARDHGTLRRRTPRHRHRDARFHPAANHRQTAAT